MGTPLTLATARIGMRVRLRAAVLAGPLRDYRNLTRDFENKILIVTRIFPKASGGATLHAVLPNTTDGVTFLVGRWEEVLESEEGYL